MHSGIVRKEVFGKNGKRDRSYHRALQTVSLLFCIPVVLLFFCCLTPVNGEDRPNGDEHSQFAEKRKSMVEQQIKARGVGDKNVLRAFSTVPRHLFIQAKWGKTAYEDTPVPIGHGQNRHDPRAHLLW